MPNLIIAIDLPEGIEGDMATIGDNVAAAIVGSKKNSRVLYMRFNGMHSTVAEKLAEFFSKD